MLSSYNKIKYVFLFFLALSISSTGFAQSAYFDVNANCPDTGSEPWSNNDVSYYTDNYGLTGSIDFKYRYDNGDYEIQMDWSTFSNQSGYIQDNALKKIIEFEAVKKIVPQVQEPYSVNVYVYYSRLCRSWLTLKIHLSKQQQIACCDDQSIIESGDIGIDENNEYYFNYRRWIICGGKCCRRQYIGTRYWDTIKELWVTSVSFVGTQTVTSCPRNTALHDCITNELIPCNDSSYDGFDDGF
ncbi:MAG: hypothetical protein A2X64_00910 [Ignavibacteria bacterium GWF2_33_9]|nr:MAG: hypothetical protein A2X64_00910 [Ignavibacteria bacterium GWF2_33_9]